MLLEQADDGERRPRRHERLALLPHVAAVLDRLDDRRPRRRAADAELLQALDQRRLGVARRRRGGVAARLERLDVDDVAGRAAAGSSSSRSSGRRGVVALVAGLDVDLAVAGERDRRARGGELGVAAVGRRVGADAHGDGVAEGVGHLAGQRALPDQPVQRQLVAVELAGDLLRRAQRRRRADRLVRLLGVLHPRRVATRRRRQERRRRTRTAIVAAHGVQRLLGQHDGVGAHVGDVAALVQTLGDAHHLRRRPAQLPAALLLQRRRHERRLRLRAVRLVLDAADGERGRLERRGERSRRRLVEDDGVTDEPAGRVEVLAGGDAASVDGDEGGA